MTRKPLVLSLAGPLPVYAGFLLRLDVAPPGGCTHDDRTQ